MGTEMITDGISDAPAAEGSAGGHHGCISLDCLALPPSRHPIIERGEEAAIICDRISEPFAHGNAAFRTATPSSITGIGCGRVSQLDCRGDDRANPVVVIAPPLICGQAEFDEVKAILNPDKAPALPETDTRSRDTLCRYQLNATGVTF